MSESNVSLMPLAPSFVVTADEIKARIEELQRFVKSYMIEGEDYGTIPGTQKPTLYKPGAEKLCDVYGFTKEIDIMERVEDWDKGRFAYTIKAILRSKRTGFVEAEGVGQCNSMEAKYRWSWVWPSQLPATMDKSQLVTKNTKKGPMYRIPNEDPFSQVNTVLKMAKKRALVDAVLSATRSSGLFTQDLEDLRANGLLPDDASDGAAVPGPSAAKNTGRPNAHRPTPEARKTHPMVQVGFMPETVNAMAQWIGGDMGASEWSSDQIAAAKELADALIGGVHDGLAVTELTEILQSYIEIEEGTPMQHAAACIAQITAYRQSLKPEPIDVEAS